MTKKYIQHSTFWKIKVVGTLIIILSGGSGYLSAQAVMKNPFIDGYFADPSLVKHKNKYYLYATVDPWGGEELAVFESSDFRQWVRKKINWPTKQQCTSPTSGGAMVWAPSVVKGRDGKFYMYVSVGSEIWAGVADAPLGPWRNLKSDNSPLISTQDPSEVHMIDADCFIDDRWAGLFILGIRTQLGQWALHGGEIKTGHDDF